MKKKAKAKAALSLIFVIMLMDVIGITLLSPVAPYIVQKFSSEALMVSMLTVLYAGGQFVAAPLIGKLGDRYGRRPVLLISLVRTGDRLSDLWHGRSIMDPIPGSDYRGHHRREPFDCQRIHRRCFQARGTIQEFCPDRNGLECWTDPWASHGRFARPTQPASASLRSRGIVRFECAARNFYFARIITRGAQGDRPDASQ